MSTTTSGNSIFKALAWATQTVVLVWLMCPPAYLFAQSPRDSTIKDAIAETIARMPFLGNNQYTFNYKSLSQFFAESENPSVGWQSRMQVTEPIIFDFHPVLTLNLYNDFNKKLSRNKSLAMSYYLAFRPHFRLYKQESRPVSMPSYPIFMGFRHLYKLNAKHYVGYGLESGHYSNGQRGCPFGASGSCDSSFATIGPASDLSAMINRIDGDFSTNLTELAFNYRFVPKLDAYKRPQQIHTASLGFILYHNRLLGLFPFGGYVEPAIHVYGRRRFNLAYSYRYHWQSGYRFSVAEAVEFIQGAHPWVNLFRSVTTFSFFLPRNTGFYISYTYGHDNYNLRLVDAGHQFGIGLVWDMFAPVEIGEEAE